MSTDRQIAANRRNAQRSTGPRTEGGKTASSGNARRHGLTGGLGEAAVLSWYRVIVEDEMAALDPFEPDPYFRAAADLARAEAHLQRVRGAEETWLDEPEAPCTAAEALLTDIHKRMLDTAAELGWDRAGSAVLRRLDQMSQRSRRMAQCAHETLGRTLARYRASAEAQRRAALRRWIEEITKRSQPSKEA